MILKETELKANMLENRLKRLEDEEIKFFKKQQIAENRAVQVLENRQKNHDQLMQKLMRYESDQKLLEIKKAKVQEQRTATKSKLFQSKMAVKQENREVKNNLKSISYILKNAKMVNIKYCKDKKPQPRYKYKGTVMISAMIHSVHFSSFLDAI